MDEITRYREQRSESACQLCDHEVEFGQTEHGYRGFVHLATGTTECPREECGACGQTFPTLAEVFSHECEAIEASRRPHLPHATQRGDSVDAPERHEGAGRSQAEPATEKQLVFLRKLIAERPMFADVMNLHADGPGGHGWTKRMARPGRCRAVRSGAGPLLQLQPYPDRRDLAGRGDRPGVREAQLIVLVHNGPAQDL